jgi:hypothetical protein
MTVQRERGCRNHPGRSSAEFPESACTTLEAAVDRMPYYRFAADQPAGTARKPGPARATPDLAYKVELWDEAKASIEITLALTANGSIGFAAYCAATREFPDRYITLHRRDGIVSRWNGPGH